MYPEIFVKLNQFLYKFGISTFNIFVGIGLVVMLLYIIKALERKNNYSREATNKLLIFFIIALVVTYGFAIFFDAFFHYLSDGVFDGGMTFIAGFIGGAISFITLIYFFMKEERKNILKLLNIVIPGVVLAHAFGRIGCFSVGCCYGSETNSIFGVLFPPGTNPYIDGLRDHIHPTQLYEAFFLFALYYALDYVPKLKGHKFAVYLISYGVFRFILERFFRGDNRGMLLGMPPSLVLSAVLVITGGVILTYNIVKLKKQPDLAS